MAISGVWDSKNHGDGDIRKFTAYHIYKFVYLTTLTNQMILYNFSKVIQYGHVKRIFVTTLSASTVLERNKIFGIKSFTGFVFVSLHFDFIHLKSLNVYDYYRFDGTISKVRKRTPLSIF